MNKFKLSIIAQEAKSQTRLPRKKGILTFAFKKKVQNNKSASNYIYIFSPKAVLYLIRSLNH